MVRDFADLQRRLIDHEDRLLAQPGSPGSRRPRCRHSSRQCLRARARQTEQRPALRRRRPRPPGAARPPAGWPSTASRLEAGPVPLSLEHNDLHHNNTFVPQPDQPLRFFDFGDSLWAHPFTSMAVPVEHMTGEWEACARLAEIQYVLDAYLEVWSDLGTTAELRELDAIRAPVRSGPPADVVGAGAPLCRRRGTRRVRRRDPRLAWPYSSTRGRLEAYARLGRPD